jgi:branched-chain amino acid transport system substrate-binding protein
LFQFGIGLAKAARRAPKKSGFDLVYDRSYTVEPQDMRAIMTEVAHLNPDSFVACSYTPDTIAITEQTRALSFNPKVSTPQSRPRSQKQRFGADVEGVIGLGGRDADAPESQNYLKRHVEMTGQEPDRWAGPVTYASLPKLHTRVRFPSPAPAYLCI